MSLIKLSLEYATYKKSLTACTPIHQGTSELCLIKETQANPAEVMNSNVDSQLRPTYTFRVVFSCPMPKFSSLLVVAAVCKRNAGICFPDSEAQGLPELRESSGVSN